MRPRRLLALLVGLVGLLAVVASGVGTTFSAFSGTTANASNVVAARPDWLPPIVSATAIAKTPGYVSGFVKQGGTYYVYANVNDDATSGVPAGMGTPTADISALTAGQTAATLTTTGGPWTVQGTSYNYRSSSSFTAGNPLAAGSKTWVLTSPDLASPVNTTTSSGLTATVDNTAPTATGVAAANKTGGVQSRPEIGDTVTFTYSEQIDPESILSGWDGTSTNVTVRINDGGAGNDTLQVWNLANTAQLNLGSINLRRTDYVSSNSVFGGPGAATNTTMVQAAGVITLTLGTRTSGTATTAAGTGNMVWTPSTSAYDRAGNAASAAAFTETDNDRDF